EPTWYQRFTATMGMDRSVWTNTRRPFARANVSTVRERLTGSRSCDRAGTGVPAADPADSTISAPTDPARRQSPTTAQGCNGHDQALPEHVPPVYARRLRDGRGGRGRAEGRDPGPASQDFESQHVERVAHDERR